jgi:hypothetical protein
LESYFPDLKQGDGLKWDYPQSEVVVLLNPPFHRVNLRQTWKRGNGSLAAVFLADIVENLPSGSAVAAILPDVLRSGSSYSAWRSVVAERLSGLTVQRWGRFDRFTDVDVFALRGVIRRERDGSSEWPCSPVPLTKLADLGDIRVGTVVPHRHADSGARKHPYATARTLPARDEIRSDELPRRSFSGRMFMPPFVAIRRTSAPSDPSRVVPTVVRGSTPVAVENHLIVVTPRTATVAECRRISSVLQRADIQALVNEKIRCRHLTVQTVGDLPVRPSGN